MLGTKALGLRGDKAIRKNFYERRDEELLSLSFKRFLLIHPSEAKGEAIPPEPEGRIGIALERAYDVSKNGSGKRKSSHPEDIFMVGCV